jgi:DNA polymerase III subunit epsilon
MTATIIVLDFETTGLSPDQGARPTEVAAVAVQGGRIIARYQSLMNAGVYVPHYITALTGITNAMVRAAPPVKQVMRELHQFVGDHPVVAHNASFDRKFLEAEWQRLRLATHSTVLCSLRLARRLYPQAPNHQLGTLVAHLGLPQTGRAHRALADAEMTAHLWLRMRADIASQFGYRHVPLDLLQRLQSVAKTETAAYLRAYRDRHGLHAYPQ